MRFEKLFGSLQDLEDNVMDSIDMMFLMRGFIYINTDFFERYLCHTYTILQAGSSS